MTSPSENCRTCGENHDDLTARGVVPKHPFNDGSVPFKTTFGNRTPRDDRKMAENGPQGAVRGSWSFDPVLRQAILDKGLITAQDLRDAEEKIRAVTAAFMEAKPRGEGEVQKRETT